MNRPIYIITMSKLEVLENIMGTPICHTEYSYLEDNFHQIVGSNDLKQLPDLYDEIGKIIDLEVSRKPIFKCWVCKGVYNSSLAARGIDEKKTSCEQCYQEAEDQYFNG